MGHPELIYGTATGRARDSLGLIEEDWTAAVEAIVSEGMWCVIEACTDVCAQRWEPVLLVCSSDEETVSGALVAWIDDFPSQDLRVCGYERDSLRRGERAPSAIGYLATSA